MNGTIRANLVTYHRGALCNGRGGQASPGLDRSDWLRVWDTWLKEQLIIWPVFLGAVGRGADPLGAGELRVGLSGGGGGGRRDVSVVIALALSGADSGWSWRISRLSALIFSLMVVTILKAINWTVIVNYLLNTMSFCACGEIID